MYAMIVSSLRFLGSRVTLVSMLLAVVFSLLPGGYWLTLGGGMRWLWGCPVPFLLVHGDSPLHSSDWGFGAFNYGPGYLGFFADWLFWVVIFRSGVFVARLVSRKAHGRIRWGFVFAGFAGVSGAIYVFAFARVLQAFFLGLFLNAA
jgi:hypothetical protein